MLMDMIQPRQIEDLDEAFGELLQLFAMAARLERIDRFGERVGPMPHALDGDLFHACWRVLNQHRFEDTRPCIEILFEIYEPEGNRQSRRAREANAKPLRRK